MNRKEFFEFLNCRKCVHAQRTPDGIVCQHSGGPRPAIAGCQNFQDKKIRKVLTHYRAPYRMIMAVVIVVLLGVSGVAQSSRGDYYIEQVFIANTWKTKTVSTRLPRQKMYQTILKAFRTDQVNTAKSITLRNYAAGVIEGYVFCTGKSYQMDYKVLFFPIRAGEYTISIHAVNAIHLGADGLLRYDLKEYSGLIPTLVNGWKDLINQEIKKGEKR